jgi:predicted ATPase
MELETVRQRIRASAIALLTRAAQQQPLALIADDVDRLDDASLDLLAALVNARPAAPLLLLAAARGAAWPTASFELTLPLEGLGDAALERTVCAAIGAARLDERVLAYLREKTGGNPLFAVTLARAALAAGAIAILPGAGNCVPVADLAAVSAPDSLAAALLTGVDALPDGERRLAQIAAVCGDRCDIAVLRAVAEPLVSGAFDRLLAGLEEHGIIARIDARRVAFLRPLLRDALYEALPSARCRVLHRRIAEAALAVPGIEEEFIAYHLGAASDPRVVPYALRLGDRARELADGAAALRAYRIVIAGPKRVWRADSAAMCRALIAAGDTLVHLQPRYAEALHHYRRALRLAGSAEQDAAVRAEIAYRVGYVCRRLGRNAAADRWLRRAARAGAGQTRCEALLERASLAYLQNMPRRALRLCAEALRMAQAIGSPAAEARVLDNRGTTLSGIGRLREAVADLERSVELSARLGNIAAEAKAAMNLGAAYFRLARWEEAARAYERARALRRRLGDSDRAAQASLNLGEVLAMRGEIATALSLFAECRAVWERSGYAVGVAHARFFAGQALERAGRLAAAVEELEAAMRTFQALQLRGLAIHAGVLLAETLADAGARRRARQTAREVARLESGGSDLHRAYALRALAVAGGLPPADAEAKLRQAVELFAALGLRWECAWTRLRLAEALAPLRAEEAADLAAATRTAFVELGTPPEEARAARLLQQVAVAHPGA